MPFCQSCGASVEGKFCAKCGTPLEGAAGGPGPSGDPTPQPASPGSGMTDNVACALCYLLGLVTGILFLVIEPYNKNRNVRFHAFQSIFLNVAWIAMMIVLSILGTVTQGIMFLLTPLLGLAFFGLWLYMMWSAYQNKKVVLPVIGPIAEKQAQG